MAEKVVLVCDKCGKDAEDRIFVTFARGGQMTMDMCKKHMTSAFGTSRPERKDAVKEVPLVTSPSPSSNGHPTEASAGVEMLPCPECGKEYKGNLGLSIHRARHHGYVSDKPYNVARREAKEKATA